MFRTILVAGDDIRLYHVESVVLRCGKLDVFQAFGQYVSAFDLERLFQTVEPDVLVIDLDDPAEGERIACRVHEAFPRAAIVAFGGAGADAAVSFDVARTGILAQVPYPVTLEALQAAVEAALHAARADLYENLLAFVPAKAGAGCTTVVASTAWAAANGLHKKVLVIEADLRSGALSVAFNTDSPNCIQRALERSEALDVFEWGQAVTRLFEVDFLLSNRRLPGRLPDWDDFYALLAFARPRYDMMLADLPELVNRATAEIVQRARHVFVVTTQEVLPLKLAERRIEELQGWKVSPGRIRVLVNRYHREEMSLGEIENWLRKPVMAAFPNDYRALRKATLAARPIPLDSRLGKAYMEFARQLAPEPSEAAGGRVEGGLPGTGGGVAQLWRGLVRR